MEPFNIRIHHQNQDITLTILPENDYYKIIYFGAIVGAIRQLKYDWELVPEEEIEPGNLPPYDHKQGYDTDSPKLELHLYEINQIAGEIENIIN